MLFIYHRFFKLIFRPNQTLQKPNQLNKEDFLFTESPLIIITIGIVLLHGLLHLLH
jgi:hypothetical protein